MTVSLEDLRPDIFCHESETVLSEIGIKRKVTTTSEESSAHPRYGFYAVGQEADMVSHFRYCLHASHFSKGGVFPPYSSACSVEFASCYSSCPPKREGFAPIARTVGPGILTNHKQYNYRARLNTTYIPESGLSERCTVLESKL